MTAFDQALNHLDHAIDVVRRARHAFRILGGNLVPQLIGVIQKSLRVVVRDLVRIIGIFNRALRDTTRFFVLFNARRGSQHFVIFAFDHMADVGDVHHVLHVVTGQLQEPPHQITEQEATKIANVGKIVNGRSARVHFDNTVLDRFEFFLLIGQRIVEIDFHKTGREELKDKVKK